MISQVRTVHLRAAEEKQNGFCWCIATNKVTLWVASYSACVIYTETIIHLSVGESSSASRLGKYPPLVYTKTVDSVEGLRFAAR